MHPNVSTQGRDLALRRFVCTCKHVEALLMHVEYVGKSAYRRTLRRGSDRVDIVPDRERDIRALTYSIRLGLQLQPYVPFIDLGTW